MTKNAVNKADVGQINTLPDFLEGTDGLGNENVTSQDVSLPRLTILQKLSPELDRADSKYIAGALEGDVINTLTGEILAHFGESVHVADVVFQRTFGVFVKRTSGGGFKGQFATEQDAIQAIATMENSSNLEVVETAIHICLLLDESGNAKGEVGIFFKSATLKASRTLNGLLKGVPCARFGNLVCLTVIQDSNKQGKWNTFKPSLKGFVNKETFAAAKRVYEQFKDVAVSVKEVNNDVTEENF